MYGPPLEKSVGVLTFFRRNTVSIQETPRCFGQSWKQTFLLVRSAGTLCQALLGPQELRSVRPC